MATLTEDTIPDTIGGSNPLVPVGSVVTGYALRGYNDTDIYRLELEAGQPYVLSAAQPRSSFSESVFEILDANGDPVPVPSTAFREGRVGLDYTGIDYFLSFEVDRTLYFSATANFANTREYQFELVEVTTSSNTAQDDLIAWDNVTIVYDGGEGFDTLSFSHFSNPVEIGLYYGIVGGQDIVAPSSRVAIQNIEAIEGTDGNDTLLGDYFQPGFSGGEAVELQSYLSEMAWRGLDGDDILGSTSGATVFDGGAGNDTADYTGAGGHEPYDERAPGVNVSLLTGLGQLGDAEGDQLISIENLIGGSGDDTLTGDHNDNSLNGGEGFDRLAGLGGDDTIDGGTIPQFGVPDENLDRAVFRFDRDEYDVTVSVDANNEMSAIVDHVGGDGSDGRDTIQNIAWLEFADQSRQIGHFIDDVPDDPGAGSPLMTLGSAVTIRPHYPGDRDIYAIDLVAGQLYELSRQSGGALSPADITLQAPGGEALNIFGLSPRLSGEYFTSVLFQAPETGRHFLNFEQLEIFFGNNGYTVARDFEILIEESQSLSTGTSGDDTILASQSADYVDALSGQDTFVFDLPDAQSEVSWAGYLSSDAGDAPTFFIAETQGTDTNGQFVTENPNMRLENFETFVGSDAKDTFDVFSEEGYEHTNRIVFEGRGGDDSFGSTVGPNHFDGGMGIDRVRYDTALDASANVAEGVFVDLVNGAGLGGIATGDTYTSIEIIHGSVNGDVLIGNSDTQELFGGFGNDWMVAGPTAHEIDGFSGFDMASFINLNDHPGRLNTQFRLDIDLTTRSAHALGQTEAYELQNIERATGSSFEDMIRGDRYDNELRGMGSYDWFIATTGNDTIDGGNGLDMISFVEHESTAANVLPDVFSSDGLPPTGAQTSGVVVNLADSSLNTGLAEGITLISVERVTGSGRQDVFYGDSGQNDFRGLGDYDWFVSSEGGRERYFGGSGLDTVTYFNATSGVIANLRNGAIVDGKETGYGTGGVAKRDLYFEIENLVGSRFDDSLTGASGRNQLNGLEGDDSLFGYGDVDYLMGGAGNDTIDGGEGTDYAIFSGNLVDYALMRDGNEVTVVGQDGTDHLTDVEYFRFDDTDVALWDL